MFWLYIISAPGSASHALGTTHQFCRKRMYTRPKPTSRHGANFEYITNNAPTTFPTRPLNPKTGSENRPPCILAPNKKDDKIHFAGVINLQRKTIKI